MVDRSVGSVLGPGCWVLRSGCARRCCVARTLEGEGNIYNNSNNNNNNSSNNNDNNTITTTPQKGAAWLGAGSSPPPPGSRGIREDVHTTIDVHRANIKTRTSSNNVLLLRLPNALPPPLLAWDTGKAMALRLTVVRGKQLPRDLMETFRRCLTTMVLPKTGPSDGETQRECISGTRLLRLLAVLCTAPVIDCLVYRM